jgi:hypothetical protein
MDGLTIGMGTSVQVLAADGSAVDHDGVRVPIHQQVDADTGRRVGGGLLDTVAGMGVGIPGGDLAIRATDTERRCH